MEKKDDIKHIVWAYANGLLYNNWDPKKWKLPEELVTAITEAHEAVMVADKKNKKVSRLLDKYAPGEVEAEVETFPSISE